MSKAVFYFRIVLVQWNKTLGLPHPKEHARAVYQGDLDELKEFFEEVHALAIKKRLRGATGIDEAKSLGLA